MKRATAFAIALCSILCAALAGCTGGPAPSAPAPGGPTPAAATPVPTPAPERVLCIVDSLEEDVPEFFEAVRTLSTQYGWELEELEAPGGFDKALGKSTHDGVIALRTQPGTSLRALSSLGKTGVPISVVDMYPGGISRAATPTEPAEQAPPEGVSYGAYEEGGIEAMVLETALAYPPHDTPVRMLALLKAEGSVLDVLYRAAIGEGKVFSRAFCYYADESNTDVGEFLQSQLDRWVEGTLDAILVEELSVAIRVMQVLEELGREDAEVFAIPNRNMGEQKKLYKKYVFPVAIGPDLAAAAMSGMHALRGSMEGAEAISWAFEPVIHFME